MKILTLAMAIAVVTPIAHTEEGNLSATSHAIEYAGNVATDAAGNASNDIQDMGHAIAVPAKKAGFSIWGFISDIFNGGQKKIAVATGDAVEINTKVYSLALRQAERENTPLNTLKSDREERQYRLARAREESDRLGKITKEYKIDAQNFKSNISATLTGITEAAKKLEGWDKAHQKNLDNLLEEHKKQGSLTAEDGKARAGSHASIALKEALVNLEDFIKKSPDSAIKIGLGERLNAMNSLLAGATKRIETNEKNMLESIAKINEFSKVDEQKVANEEASMKRQMILGTLNNSVNNLIIQAEYSKVRSQLAFSHFNEIENELKVKGVLPGDVKKQYIKNKDLIASQYNNTPIGIYVNSQISKAMGSVCDLVANKCIDGTNAKFFEFLDNTSRFEFKDSSENSTSVEKKIDGLTK